MNQLLDLLILAKRAAHHTPAELSGGSDGKSLSISWAIVGVGLIVGLLVTLSPTKRTTEIKRGRED